MMNSLENIIKLNAYAILIAKANPRERKVFDKQRTDFVNEINESEREKKISLIMSNYDPFE